MSNKPYCRIFGTRYVKNENGNYSDFGGEYTFYSGGKFFVDTDIIIQKVREKLFLYGKRDVYQNLGNVGAYLCFPLVVRNQPLLCFSRAGFHTYPGRETQYRQIFIFDRESVCNSNAFLDDVLSIVFRSEEQIMAMAEEEPSEAKVYETRKILPIDVSELPENRRISLCRIIRSIMTGEKVIVRMPSTDMLQQDIDTLLLQLYSLLPSKGQPEVSFSTVRTEADFPYLRDIDMVIEPDEMRADESGRRVVRMDREIDTSGLEELIFYSKESQEDRRELDSVFTSDLKADFETICRYYTAEAWWWAENEPDRSKFFHSLLDAYSYFERYPCFTVSNVKKRFCSHLPDLMDYEGGIQEAALDALFASENRITYSKFQKIREKMLGFGLVQDETERLQEEISRIDKIYMSIDRIYEIIDRFKKQHCKRRTN